jgi:uncharacterized SAM-binding protein YcdF (DUF218 family)
MFFILSKLLLLFISPFFWVVIALYFGFFSKNEKRKKRGKWLAIGLLLFFSNSAIYLEFCRAWEIHGTPISKIKNYDVGIVLGGMAEYDTNLKELSIRRGGDRIWQAISLYKKGKIKKILISGDNGYLTDRGLHEAPQLKKVLVLWGIPAKDILIESVSKNTYENAIESKKILKKNNLLDKKLLLITSGRHMRRSRACFLSAGMKISTFSTDLYTSPECYFYWDQIFVPDLNTFTEWNGLIKEWIGYVAYNMTGKI